MYYRIFFVSLLILCNCYAFCIDNYHGGARSLALSNASVSFSDVWSTFNNQAGLANLHITTAGFFYESKFQLEELSLSAGSLIVPTETGNFGISFFQFGKGSFKENKVGLAFSKRLTKKWSAGIQLDYFSQRFPENQRSKSFLTFEGGILFSPTDELFLGFHVFNPVNEGIETFSGKQKMPFELQIGGSYRFGETVIWAFETEKSSASPVMIKSGIEFLPVKNLALRFGVSGKPFKYTTGIGYQAGILKTDIGFSYHGNLGLTPSVSLQFDL